MANIAGSLAAFLQGMKHGRTTIVRADPFEAQLAHSEAMMEFYRRRYEKYQRPDAVIERPGTILHFTGGARREQRLRPNCRNCGAPWELHLCSYCLTPTP